MLLPKEVREMNVSKSEGGRPTHEAGETTAEMDRSNGCLQDTGCGVKKKRNAEPGSQDRQQTGAESPESGGNNQGGIEGKKRCRSQSARQPCAQKCGRGNHEKREGIGCRAVQAFNAGKFALQEFFQLRSGCSVQHARHRQRLSINKKSQRPNGTDQVTAYGGKLHGADLRDRSQQSCIQQHGWLHQNDESAANFASN